MHKIAIIALCVVYVSGSPSGYGQSSGSGQQEFVNEQPMPYDFSYQIVDESGNQQARSENADGNGVVQGSYQYANVDGIQRTVQYTADDSGFHATINTNEPGTDNKNPADVQISANPVTVSQQAKNYGSNSEQLQLRSAYGSTQGYQQQSNTVRTSGYGQGTSGYGQRSTSGSGQRTSGFGQGTSGYGQGISSESGQRTSGFGQGTSGYGQGRSSGSGQRTSSFGQGTSGYGQRRTSGYGQRNTFQQQSPNLRVGSNGYNQQGTRQLSGRTSQSQYQQPALINTESHLQSNTNGASNLGSYTQQSNGCGFGCKLVQRSTGTSYKKSNH